MWPAGHVLDHPGVYSSVEPKFCDRYSLFVKCIGTLSNEFTRFEQPTAALV